MKINKMVLQGNICGDPEMRVTKGGKSVLTFTLGWSIPSQAGTERKLFLRCAAWGKMAEVIQRHYGKGGEILVEGKLLSKGWTDAGGNKHRDTELWVDSFYFQSGRLKRGDDPEKRLNAIDAERKARKTAETPDFDRYDDYAYDESFDPSDAFVDVDDSDYETPF